MNSQFSFIRFLIFTLLVVIFSEQSAFSASDSLKDQLQKLVDRTLATEGKQEYISAITLSVNSPKLKNPITVFTGHTEMSNGVLVNALSLYQIGSITKSFVSVILLQLETTPRYHFNINDPLGKYFPQYSPWKNITVKQLLNMTSGIPTYDDEDQFLQDFSQNPSQQVQPEALLAYVQNKPLIFTPGTAWNYSNTNYILAGMLVQKLTGKTLEENMNERFFNLKNSSNLVLPNSYYLEDYAPLYPEPKEIYNRMVHGYTSQSLEPYFPAKMDITDVSLSWAGAAGAIIATPKDVATWAEALFTSTALLPEKQRKELESFVSTKTGQPAEMPTPNDPKLFGLGIGFFLKERKSIFYYQGGTLGYRVTYIFSPKENIVIAVGVNSSGDASEQNINNRLMRQAYTILKNST